MNNIERKIFVLKIVSMSNNLIILKDKICMVIKIPIMNAKNNSIEKIPIPLLIKKNQNEIPADVVKALILGDDNSILNWINKWK
jgi:hypothetical protein